MLHVRVVNVPREYPVPPLILNLPLVRKKKNSHFACRYSCCWIDDYKDNLQKFFSELIEILPEQTLVVWNLAMPVGERIKGGFLVTEVHPHPPCTI